MLQADERLLTTQEVAEIVGLKVCTIRKWKTERIGPTYIKLGSAVRYRLADVLAWIEQNERRPLTGTIDL